MSKVHESIRIASGNSKGMTPDEGTARIISKLESIREEIKGYIDSEGGTGDNEDEEINDSSDKRLKTHEIVVEFSCSDQHDETEFARQLNIQETGMNQLTIDEYLKNRERYEAEGRTAEGNALQQAIRAGELSKKVDEFRKTGLTLEEATEQAQKWLDTQAVLHNPDQVAGGNPLKIGGMGDAGINSSIGAQWKYRIGSVDDYIYNLILDMSEGERYITYLNIRLTYSRR